MLRKCSDCGLEAHDNEGLNLFTSAPGCKHGKRNRCIQCSYKISKAAAEKNPKKTRDWKTKHQVMKRYGITPEQYAERMATSSVCECCGNKENLCYDHCHDTMAFRGVLCRSCNRSIGQLGDTLEGVERALNYLRKHYETH